MFTYGMVNVGMEALGNVLTDLEHDGTGREKHCLTAWETATNMISS